MIKSFDHKGLESFFRTGSKAGIQPACANKIARQLARLNEARNPQDMNLPSWRLHSLQGTQMGIGRYGLTATGALLFRFDGNDAILVNYH